MNFLNGAAVRELEKYKSALAFDIAFLENPDYFHGVRVDFACFSNTIPHGNESIVNSIDVAIEYLLLERSEEQFDKLPLSPEDIASCSAYPAFKVRHFLDVVAVLEGLGIGLNSHGRGLSP